MNHRNPTLMFERAAQSSRCVTIAFDYSWTIPVSLFLSLTFYYGDIASHSFSLLRNQYFRSQHKNWRLIHLPLHFQAYASGEYGTAADCKFSKQQRSPLQHPTKAGAERRLIQETQRNGQHGNC